MWLARGEVKGELHLLPVGLASVTFSRASSLSGVLLLGPRGNTSKLEPANDSFYQNSYWGPTTGLQVAGVAAAFQEV